MRDLKTFKRCAYCMRVNRENLSACKAFVDFWDDHVIIPRASHHVPCIDILFNIQYIHSMNSQYCFQ